MLGRTTGELGLPTRFRGFASGRRPAPFLDLWVIATPEPKPDAELLDLASQHFPQATTA